MTVVFIFHFTLLSVSIKRFELFWLYCCLAVLFWGPEKSLPFCHMVPACVSHLGMVACYNIKSMWLPEEILELLWVPEASLNVTYFLYFVFCLLFCFVSPLFQTDTNKSITQKPLTQVFSHVAIFLLLGHMGYANDKANHLMLMSGRNY